MAIRFKGKVSNLIILILFFSLLYVPSLIQWSYQWITDSVIKTDMIRMGTIEEFINLEACIIRDEEVLVAPFSGKCIFNAVDGEKVPVNYKVSSVLKEASDKIIKDINELDLRMAQLIKEKNLNQEIFTDDIIKLDNEIGQNIKLLRTKNDRKSPEESMKIVDEINNLVKKKYLVSNGGSAADSYTENLKQERQNLEMLLNANKNEIVSKTSGIITYNTDGYEAMLNPASLNSLTPEKLSEIKQVVAVTSNTSKMVEGGKPFGKIIKDSEYFIATPIDSSKVNGIKQGDLVKIRINDIGKVTEGEIYSISEAIEKQMVLIIKTNKGLIETSGMRRINVDMIKSSQQGLKVPVKCLKDLDLKSNTAKIVLDKANYASVREIKIVGNDGEYAIIDNLDSKNKNGISLYDVYITNPANVDEGQMINQ